MEKRRIRLEINGVVCGLITQESEEYMQSLAGEVGEMMKEILAASPFVTREAAALTTALSYCDDAKKNGRKAFELQERVDELEVEAELWQEEKEEMQKAPAAGDSALAERVAKLEAENTALEEAAQKAGDLEERAAALRDENEALREAVQSASAGAGERSALEERLAGLREENASLRESVEALEAKAAGDAPQREELAAQQEELDALREKTAALEAENSSLLEAAQALPVSPAPEDGGEDGPGLAELKAENEALRRRAEEQEALVRKTEQEKQGAVSAAKRAVEEARKVVDQLREEADQARAEAERARRTASAPALTTLERMAEEAGPEEGPESRGGAAARGQAGSRRKRKNPLRYEEDFEQEGFVSFFEKK